MQSWNPSWVAPEIWANLIIFFEYFMKLISDFFIAKLYIAQLCPSIDIIGAHTHDLFRTYFREYDFSCNLILLFALRKKNVSRFLYVFFSEGTKDFCEHKLFVFRIIIVGLQGTRESEDEREREMRLFIRKSGKFVGLQRKLFYVCWW